MQTPPCYSSPLFRVPSRDSYVRLADRPLIDEKCSTPRFTQRRGGAYRFATPKVGAVWLWICRGFCAALGIASLLVSRNAVVWNALDGRGIYVSYSAKACKSMFPIARLPSSSLLERIGICMMMNWILYSGEEIC